MSSLDVTRKPKQSSDGTSSGKITHFYENFVEGVESTSLCGAKKETTASAHDPKAPRCVVCLDLVEGK